MVLMAVPDRLMVHCSAEVVTAMAFKNRRNEVKWIEEIYLRIFYNIAVLLENIVEFNVHEIEITYK